LKEEFIKIQKKYSQKTYIYFNYLNNAAWIGLGEKDLFTAASTIKVPLAMAIYKMIEERKLKASDTYALDQLELDNGFGDLYKVGPDKTFTIDELIKIMLEKSDNTAMKALYKVLELNGIEDPFSDVYASMGWDYYPEIGEVPSYFKINLKTLSNMFIALYNAKYINTEYSNQILEHLTNSQFNDQIIAGVPNNIPVAHKIGVTKADNTFSDCGIIYLPHRYYLLCLGSNGANEKSANKFMAEISKAAYQYVINN
jgi:beta-lactamase class A